MSEKSLLAVIAISSAITATITLLALLLVLWWNHQENQAIEKAFRQFGLGSDGTNVSSSADLDRERAQIELELNRKK